MFKKTLLALSIAGFSMGANAAASSGTAGGLGQLINGVNNGAVLASAEGATGATTFDINGETLTYTVGSDNQALYGSLAKIRVTLTGADFSPATVLDAAVTDAGGTDGSDDLDANTGVTYTATNVLEMPYDGTASGIDTGETVTISGLRLTPASVASGSKVTALVEMVSSVAGTVIDSATFDVVNVITQYSAKASTKFDATIDVTEDRMLFTDGTSNDTVGLQIKSKQVDILAADATAGKATFKVMGDFTYLDSDADGKLDSDVTVTGATFAEDMMSFTFKTAGNLTGDGAAADTDTESVTITGSDDRVMKAQSFTADVDFAYLDAKATAQAYALEGTAAGSWGLNGTSVNVPYLPTGFGSLSANIEISNTSGVDAEVTIDAIDNNGVAHAAVKLDKVAAAGAVTKISEADIVDAFGLTEGTKLSLNLTINSPSGISVYPYYRENDVRVSLPTSQYRAVQCKATGSTTQTDAVAADSAGNGLTLNQGGSAAAGATTNLVFGDTTVSTTCTKDFN